MLTKLEIAGARSTPPALSLADGGSASSDPLQVLNIDGLGPVKAEITTVPFSTFDGEAYSGGSAIGKRNIVLTIGLNPDWNEQTYEELRRLLYAYFMPKLQTRLIFTSTHLPVCQIDGYVESLEPNMFSKDPQAVISILCPSPHFIAKEESVINGYSTSLLNPVLNDITCNGSVAVGFKLQVKKGTPGDSGEVPIGIYMITEFDNQVFRCAGKVDSNNYFEMSTIPGRKFVRSVSTRTGKPTNYLNKVDIGSGWPKIYPGVNSFGLIMPIPGQHYRLSYFEQFGGL